VTINEQTSNYVYNDYIANYMQDTYILSMLSYKASRPIRLQYKLMTHHITVLTACYLFHSYIKTSFTRTDLFRLLGYYSQWRIKGYISRLLDCKFITQAGRYYSITQLGIDTIKQVNENSNTLVYSFCQKYNIEL
jgi:hypothetical protein